ncbi:MAG: insulinase family protein [Gemmatimonadaceae bacterium]|nr:insulinase family protein [Gemmatimonadaceae bacterium]
MRLLLATTLTATTLAAQPTTTRRAPVPPPSTPPRTGVAVGVDTITESFQVGALRVLLRHVTSNDVIAANLYLLGGTRQVTPATAGIESFLLEVSERGTQRYPKAVLRQKMAALGTAIGVNPSLDWTVVGLRATASTLDSTFAIFADRIMRPRLDSTEIEFVREQLVTAVQQRNDTPESLLDHLADSMAFTGHSYGIDPIGTDASLSRLTRAQLLAFHKEQFVTSRMLMVVVGNVTRAKVERLLRGSLATLPAGSYRWSLPDSLPTMPTAVTYARKELPTNYIKGLFAGPRAGTRDYHALRFATAILSGRLFSEVRSKRNLTYSVNSPFLEHGVASGGLYVTTVEPNAVLDIMRQEIRALQGGTITAESLERLVRGFIVEYYLDNETNAEQADLLARAELYEGDYRKAAAFTETLRSITPQDIQRVAREYMKNVRWAYVGNPGRVTPRAFAQF